MKITLITVGKIKEKYLKDAIAEYSKRLSAYYDINIIELQDEKTPDKAPVSIEEKIKETEGNRILQKISDRAYVIALAINGDMLSSEELADKMSDLMVRGNSDIVFVIGGSLGLSPEVLRRANYKLSFSRMTFPHQLMRVILLEQVYRAFKINSNEPYHK
ncbi:23S rRNA (pseudouridine(1915)-N(3))-methyltransferase RlmH [Oribacterium sp. WCC10]|uniref:23S rRNA (pseudouridine(1915)-N(3))-methyltransferase RlmH n=1 Tax=Oribacterium sp. WCC10 TaxID=1855343 RepID=UPI0008EA9858|nr:23S rRNA (pseudouridine(1915)-N(3))-methyltransferase RlmH [Oribacterium sp. WCC10]SFG19494.1 23S rRNA (pseudouridine1915-N3)-methyltransferase [Oribacterium sp. WCC10]